MACGYPAVIIKDQHKKSYYQLLGDIQAYGGNPNLFYDFLADRVLDTQALVLDAIAGKDIDEEDDIDKMIHQAKLELAQKAGVIEQPLTRKSAELLLDSCIKESFHYILDKALQFKDEFVRVNKNIDFQINNSGRGLGYENNLNKVFDNMQQMLNAETIETRNMVVGIHISFNGFKKSTEERHTYINIKFILSDLIGKVDVDTSNSNTKSYSFYYNEINGGTTFMDIKKQIDTALTVFVKHIVSLANE
jgi:hypothetical protein